MKEKMEMTTPVLTSQYKSDGEKMDMTTPVIMKNVSSSHVKLVRPLLSFIFSNMKFMSFPDRVL